MISRVWRATATPDGALGYAQHFQSHVVPALGGIAGYQDALLLQSPTTLWHVRRPETRRARTVPASSFLPRFQLVRRGRDTARRTPLSMGSPPSCTARNRTDREHQCRQRRTRAFSPLRKKGDAIAP